MKGLTRQNGVLFRLALKIQAYDFDIRHLSGNNMIMDYPTRQSHIVGDEALNDPDMVTFDENTMIMDIAAAESSAQKMCELTIDWQSKHAKLQNCAIYRQR